jgi:hypothetical protein
VNDEASTMDFEELLDGQPLPEVKHTPTVKQIREWAGLNGFDCPPKGRIPVDVREAYNKANNIVHVPKTSNRVAETAPKYEPQTVSGKVKGFFNKSSSKAVRTKKSHPRVSVADLITGAWWLISKAAEPISPPMAKMLAMEAPIAGMMLDETVKGSVVDKVLQPLARTEESSKAFAALITPPLLVGVIDKNPSMANNLLPILRKSLQWHVELAGPMVAEKMQREQEFEAQYGQQVDAMIMLVFGVEEENATADPS